MEDEPAKNESAETAPQSEPNKLFQLAAVELPPHVRCVRLKNGCRRWFLNGKELKRVLAWPAPSFTFKGDGRAFLNITLEVTLEVVDE